MRVSNAVATEEVERKFHRLLSLDRNSPEFEPLFEEVDRLLTMCVRFEREERELPYASHSDMVVGNARR